MVGMTPELSRELIASGISSLKYGGSGDIGSNLGLLRRLRDQLLVADSVLLLEFLSPILDLLSDRFSPVRKFVTQFICQIGLKHLELLPEIIPALIDVLKDDTPAVARQAISSGNDIFRYALVKVAIQGLYSSEFNESLKSSWACVLKFKDEIYSMAFTEGSDSRRLPALKFVASVVLLYTSDPNGSLTPPSDPISEGNIEEFNASWFRGGHPILNVGDLSVEAGRSLSLLLDQLRFPSMKSHSNLMLIVLIKSLSAVARKRPAFYGRILPVLLGLDLSTSSRKGIHLAGVNHALKNAFEACLDCSHPGAVPWRDRLVSALAENKVGRPIQTKDLDENGRRAVWRGDLNVSQVQEEDKPSIAFDTKHVNAGRKRTADMPHLTEDESPGKCARSTPERLEELADDTSAKQDITSTAPTPSESDAVSEPVQQLVAMFGALVAQGEKAVASLEILISSISADLLAEVVLANMRNIPLNLPRPEGDEGLHIDTQPGMVESNIHLKYLSLLLIDVLSQSNSAGKGTEVEELHHSVSSKLEKTEEEKPQVSLADNSVASDGSTLANQPARATEHVSGEDTSSAMDISYKDITSEANERELVENGIPGLALSTKDVGLHENVAIVSEDTANLDDSNQEKCLDLGAVPLELDQSLPSERSEELSPKAEVTDITSINSSTATSVALTSQLILPQMSAPVIQLADEQKDQLQEVAFERIVDAYKQVAIAGGSQVRFSILAHSGMEFPSELDPWKLLKTHILSDYVNHEGHELTLRVLYRLFGETEEDRDFFSSSTATSVYETFLLQLAEAVRDFFPASDKSLGRLLGEVPYLPKSLLEMLKHLCSPGSSDNDDKELRGGDRVTQGLSTAWSLILLRPPIRDACLKICLKSAVHHLEEVRMKAIRLVANKLYPLSHISGKIEDFAKEMLLSVASDDHIRLIKEVDGTHAELQKDENHSGINQSASSASKDISSETHQLPASESIPSSTVAEVQRCMSLYFALCTKKHSLLRQIFDVYEGTSKVTKQTIHGQIPLLVRTIGSSRDLLDIISDPPTGSEGLVTQVVSTLTDGTVPSPDLISSIKRLYNRKLKDVDVLLPILPFLPKDELLLIFPHLVNTPLDKFQIVLSRVLQGSNRSTPALTPAEALIAIHGIDPEKDGIPLKKVTDACNACFEQRQIFTQQVIAKVLNQLVEQIPLPLLFMRTVLQAIGAFPALVDFIMEILSRLVSKQIWKYPKLWVGFMKCTLLTKPQSFAVLLQLPPAQLENVLNRTAALKAPLIAHASQPHIRSSLPRSTLVVLGIVSEVQNSTQAPPARTQNSPAQTQNSPAQTQNSPAQTQNSPSQTQNSPAQTQNSPARTQTRTEETQTGETQTQTLDTGNSEKEEGADKSKESSTVD